MMRDQRVKLSRYSISTILMITLAGTLSAIAQQTSPTTDVFAGVERFSKGATEVKDINLDKDALKVVGSMNSKASGVASMMDTVSIHKYEFPRAGLYSMSDVLEYSRRLDKDGWKQVVHKQDASESKDIYTRTVDGGEWKELAIIEAESKELKFIYLRYHGSLANLGAGLGSMDDTLSGKSSASSDPKLAHRP